MGDRWKTFLHSTVHIANINSFRSGTRTHSHRHLYTHMKNASAFFEKKRFANFGKTFSLIFWKTFIAYFRN